MVITLPTLSLDVVSHNVYDCMKQAIFYHGLITIAGLSLLCSIGALVVLSTYWVETAPTAQVQNLTAAITLPLCLTLVSLYSCNCFLDALLRHRDFCKTILRKLKEPNAYIPMTVGNHQKAHVECLYCRNDEGNRMNSSR